MKRTAISLHDIESEQRLDRVVDAARPIADRLDESAGDLLSGEWLGHPLHPALTDLPIGFWTSACVLDLVGGRRSRPAVQRLIALGIISVIPTAAAGLVDWNRMEKPSRRRVGVVHALTNTTATILYVMSWRARRRDRHFVGVVLGLLGAGAATVGGYLGGHLAFAPDSDGDNDVARTVDATNATAQTPEAFSLDGLIGA